MYRATQPVALRDQRQARCLSYCNDAAEVRAPVVWKFAPPHVRGYAFINEEKDGLLFLDIPGMLESSEETMF